MITRVSTKTKVFIVSSFRCLTSAPIAGRHRFRDGSMSALPSFCGICSPIDPDATTATRLSCAILASLNPETGAAPICRSSQDRGRRHSQGSRDRPTTPIAGAPPDAPPLPHLGRRRLVRRVIRNSSGRKRSGSLICLGWRRSVKPELARAPLPGNPEIDRRRRLQRGSHGGGHAHVTRAYAPFVLRSGAAAWQTDQPRTRRHGIPLLRRYRDRGLRARARSVVAEHFGEFLLKVNWAWLNTAPGTPPSVGSGGFCRQPCFSNEPLADQVRASAKNSSGTASPKTGRCVKPIKRFVSTSSTS